MNALLMPLTLLLVALFGALQAAERRSNIICVLFGVLGWGQPLSLNNTNMSKKKSAERIDGIVALIIVLDRVTMKEPCWQYTPWCLTLCDGAASHLEATR